MLLEAHPNNTFNRHKMALVVTSNLTSAQMLVIGVQFRIALNYANCFFVHIAEKKAMNWLGSCLTAMMLQGQREIERGSAAT